MDIKPITTPAEHRAALAEINSLMVAEKSTPEGERLDALANFVVAYEASEDRAWLDMKPVGREFGSPDYDTLVRPIPLDLPAINDLPDFDATHYLDSEAAIAAYLADALETNDPALIEAAHSDIARVRARLASAESSSSRP